MIKIIDKIFQHNSFVLLEKAMKDPIKREQNRAGEKLMDTPLEEWKTVLRRIYVNEQDEMYFLVEGELNRNALNEVIGICAEAEGNVEIKKSYKSNWGLLYLTSVDETLTREEQKRVMQIEENKYFCRKYVLWYSNEEKEKLMELCQENYSNKNLNSIVENYDFFSRFKQSNHKGYECLSRIYIKLPFMNLSDLETTDQTVLEVVKKKLDEFHPELFHKLQNGDMESIESYVNLSEKEEKDIQRILSKLKVGTR